MHQAQGTLFGIIQLFLNSLLMTWHICSQVQLNRSQPQWPGKCIHHTLVQDQCFHFPFGKKMGLVSKQSLLNITKYLHHWEEMPGCQFLPKALWPSWSALWVSPPPWAALPFSSAGSLAWRGFSPGVSEWSVSHMLPDIAVC